MALNRVEDLIPHKESLKALYRLEEFQIIHNFLSSLRQQLENEIFMYQLELQKKTSLEVHLKLQELLVKRNTIFFIETLPGAVQGMEDQIEAQRAMAENFKNSQKG